jgi:uncharacterized membrane protein YbhN (UPF0104 family)
MQGQSGETNFVSSSISHWHWLKISKLTGQFALGVVLLWWIVDRVDVDSARITQAFGQASFGFLSLAVICFALSIILKSLQYFALIPSPISSGYMAGVILSQHALLTFLPWRIGEISLPVLLRQDQKVPLVNSVSSLIVVRSVDLLIVLIVATTGIQKLGFEVSFARIAFGVGIVGVVGCAADLLARGFRGQTLLETVVPAIKRVNNPLIFGNLLLLSVAIFFLSTAQSMFVLQGLGLAVSLTDVALLNALSLLAALLPIHPPGGWGTIDSIQIAILHYLNYQLEDSAPVILAAHCFYTLLILLGGMFGWILREKSLRR